MRASIKGSLAARRHRLKIVMCKRRQDRRWATTTSAGASSRRGAVHNLTATRPYLFSSRRAAANESLSDRGHPGLGYVAPGGSVIGLDLHVGDFPRDMLVEGEKITAVERNLSSQ